MKHFPSTFQLKVLAPFNVTSTCDCAKKKFGLGERSFMTGFHTGLQLRNQGKGFCSSHESSCSVPWVSYGFFQQNELNFCEGFQLDSQTEIVESDGCCQLPSRLRTWQDWGSSKEILHQTLWTKKEGGVAAHWMTHHQREAV